MTFTATSQITSTAPPPWQTLKRVGAAVAIGGIMFWLPSAIWHLVRAEDCHLSGDHVQCFNL